MSEIVSTVKSRKRIGISLVGFDKADLPALRFLVLQMNQRQQAFEYEFLSLDESDQFVKLLTSPKEVNREDVKAGGRAFALRHTDYLTQHIAAYGLKQPPPDYFVLVTLTRFHDGFYSTRQGPLSVIALGNWKRVMAPPSLLEFVLTLLVRESVASVSHSLRGSVHLGTKGCLCDFTDSLDDVRFKVLSGFLCQYCRLALKNDGYLDLADELSPLLRRRWLGKPTDPNSPASIAAKLGYNLFTTKGLEAGRLEKLKTTVQEEGAKQIITIIGTILIAGLLVWLGWKKD